MLRLQKVSVPIVTAKLKLQCNITITTEIAPLILMPALARL